MLLQILALALALPQLAGYVVTRLWRGSGHAEWLGTAVATYTALWYAACHAMVQSTFAWGLLAAGLIVEVLFGLLLAGIVFQLRRRRAQGEPGTTRGVRIGVDGARPSGTSM